MIKTYEIRMAEKYGGKTLTVDIDMSNNGVVTEENVGEEYAKSSKNGLFVKVKGKMIYVEVD